MGEAFKLGMAVPGSRKDSEKTHIHVCAHGLRKGKAAHARVQTAWVQIPTPPLFNWHRTPVPIPSTGKWGGSTSDPAEVSKFINVKGLGQGVQLSGHSKVAA